MKITKKTKWGIIAIYFMICTVINFVKFLPELMEAYNGAHFSFSQMLLPISFMVIVSFVCAIIFNIFPIIIIVVVSLAKRKVKRQNLSKIDVKKYFGYYRDMISEYSPAVLSYIDNLEVEPKKDIVATLLGLKLKKKIDIIDGNIKVIDSSKEGLENNEKYILENGIDNCNEFVFETMVKDDAKAKGLIKTQTKITLKNIISLFVSILIIGCAYIFLAILLSGNMEITTTNILLIAIVAIVCTFSPVIAIVYSLSYIISATKNNNIRTEKGEEINKKLEGLKNYIKDYSNLEKKEEKELILWEDYLIYSVIFNQNKEIIKEIYK